MTPPETSPCPRGHAAGLLPAANSAHFGRACPGLSAKGGDGRAFEARPGLHPGSGPAQEDAGEGSVMESAAGARSEAASRRWELWLDLE